MEGRACYGVGNTVSLPVFSQPIPGQSMAGGELVLEASEAELREEAEAGADCPGWRLECGRSHMPACLPLDLEPDCHMPVCTCTLFGVYTYAWCTWVHVSVNTCVYIHVCEKPDMQARVHVACVSVCMCIYAHLCEHIYVQYMHNAAYRQRHACTTHVNAHVVHMHMNVCAIVHTCRCVCTYVNVYIGEHMHMHVCVYICEYIYA